MLYLVILQNKATHKGAANAKQTGTRCKTKWEEFTNETRCEHNQEGEPRNIEEREETGPSEREMTSDPNPPTLSKFKGRVFLYP